MTHSKLQNLARDINICGEQQRRQSDCVDARLIRAFVVRYMYITQTGLPTTRLIAILIARV